MPVTNPAVTETNAHPLRIAELAAVGPEGRLEFRIQRRLRTPNEILGCHWREKYRERKGWQAHCVNALVFALGVRVVQALLIDNGMLVGCHGGCRSRRRVEIIRLAPGRRNFIRDDDNLRFAVKPLLDALTHLGLIRDDHRKWLELPPPAQELSHDGTFWTWLALDEPKGSA